MTNYVRLSLLFIIGILCLLSCKSEQDLPDPQLATLDLLRGDILLCGNQDFGEVSFSFGCKNSSRKTFNLAISLLHSFEYQEAEKAFVKVIDMDPKCAMAYWGVAMSMYHALWAPPTQADLEKGSKILAIGASLPMTSKEEQYFDAIGTFYTDWENLDHKVRAAKMEKQMQAIYTSYPDDAEAAIFYALTLNSTADPTDKSYLNQRKAGKILESLFPDNPNHPGIAHYIIHNYDNPELAPMALNTARRYAGIAPSSAHAQHMPSHIFTRLGLWQESITSNINSAESAKCYSESTQNDGHWNQEIHAVDYLMYAYLQKGDNENAQKQLDYLKSVESVYPHNLIVGYPFAAIPARMALENKDWTKAEALSTLDAKLSWDKFPWEKSIIHFGRVLGASNLGHIELAQKELSQLESLQKELVNKEETYKANQVAIQVKASKAWIEFAKGNTNKALILMSQSADKEDQTAKHPVTPGEVLPARELLADMFLSMNKHAEALNEYEKSLKTHPNRFNSLYGAATSARLVKDATKAKMYFDKLLEISVSSDNERRELKDARDFISQHSI